MDLVFIQIKSLQWYIIYILGKCFLNFESIFDFDSIFDLDLIFDLDFPSKREDGYVQWI